jgi:adenylate cyclase class IV
VLRLRQDDQRNSTYKGPSKTDAELRIRTEIELMVDSFEKAVLFLEALGYTSPCSTRNGALSID